MISRRPINEAVLERRIAELGSQISEERDVLCRLYLIQQRLSLQEDLGGLHRAKRTTVGASQPSGGATGEALRREVRLQALRAIRLGEDLQSHMRTLAEHDTASQG